MKQETATRAWNQSVASNVSIRGIDRLDDVRQVEELQKEAWGMSDRDVVPLTEMVAVRDTGGQLIGAFEGDLLVGFVYGWVAIERGETAHHSHLLAVKPSRRGEDIGYRLKLAQRERVLAQGIRRITWTFDPLQSLNAWFNFRKLGVISDCYKVNLYGESTSSALHRNGTDRLWVSWLLDSPRVAQRLREGPDAAPVHTASATSWIEVDAEGAPRAHRGAGRCGELASIDIPADINALQRQDPTRAVEWREATRAVFNDALAAGYQVVDFVRTTRAGAPVGSYLLSRTGGIGGSDGHSS
jgi:predicted GNAT superfamily acetyltransferase